MFGGLILDNEPIAGVCDLEEVDYAALEKLHQLDMGFVEHLLDCDLEDHDRCMWDGWSNIVFYSDKPIQLSDSGLVFPPLDCSIFMKLDMARESIQVIRSDTVEKHGMCSAMYPNNADLSMPGGIDCYAVPLAWRAAIVAGEVL